MKPAPGAAPKPAASSSTDAVVRLPFQRRNYVLLLIGMALLALGYYLMSTESFIDSRQFSLALHVSPILILGGYGWIIYAILWRAKAR